MFDTYKTRIIGLPCGEETITFNMLSQFHRNLERDGQTDRRNAMSVSCVSLHNTDCQSKLI